MSNFPTSLDDSTTMPVVTDNVTHVVASHHNNQSDAIVAIETKVGTGASTPATGKVMRGNGTGTSEWAPVDMTTDVTGTLPVANGGTNAATAADARTSLGAAASGANTDITSVYLDNTGLKVKDSNASHGLTLKPGSNLTADKTLTLTTGDADRTVTLNGDTTLTGTNTGDQVVPANEAGAANNFLSAYNSTTGAWTKSRPTWANIDKATSSIADITTRSHTALTDIGTNTHAQIDTHLAATLAGHAATTSAQLAGVISDETGTDKLVYNTSPSLITPKITTSINDANGNEVIKTPATSSAINEITITNAAVGVPPTIGSTGGDSNIDLNLLPKGTGGVVFLDGSGNEVLKGGSATASAVNEVTVTNAATGNPPIISTTGGDTDAGLTLASKGTGVIKLKSGSTTTNGHTVPNVADDTVALLAAVQTFTNKTHTSPTINTPTLVLADSSPTADGSIGFDRTGEDLQIGDGSVSQIVHMGAWTAFTPTPTNLTVGSGTWACAYTQIGKFIGARYKFTFAADSSVSGAITLSLPVTAWANDRTYWDVHMVDAGTADFFGLVRLASTTTIDLNAISTGGTYAGMVATSSTVPHTWATGDYFTFLIFYEAA